MVGAWKSFVHMSRPKLIAELISLRLDRDQTDPIHLQLDQEIRRLILNRDLSPGTKLPSSRRLATELKCSRNTVLVAYEQLIAEGFLKSNAGSGTFVSSDIKFGHVPIQETAIQPATQINDELSALGRHFENLASSNYNYGKAFSLAGPNVDSIFPEVWARLSAKTWRQSSFGLLFNNDVIGYLPLREALVEYLATTRGVNCEVEQVFVTSGASEALALLSKLLVNPGDDVWFENPGSFTGRNVLAAAGVKIIPVSVDSEGLAVKEGIQKSPRAKMTLVTPSHQFPLGVVMSVARRLELLDWANSVGSWIVEDDYDSEYRYVGRPLPTLQSLDQNGRVIYVGTFSKVLFEPLRIGYMVLPKPLARRFAAVRGKLEHQSQVSMQAVMALYMTEGHFVSHVNRMRRLYASRRNAMMKTGSKLLAGLLEFSGDLTGLHVVGYFSQQLRQATSDIELADYLTTRDIITTPLSRYCADDDDYTLHGLVLGYATIDEKTIEQSIRKLAKSIKLFLADT